MDCVLICSDPAREVIDIAGEGRVEWFADQGPAINEDRAALADKARLESSRCPTPTARAGCTTASRSIEICFEDWPVDVHRGLGRRPPGPGPGAPRAQPDHDRRHWTTLLSSATAGLHFRSGHRLCRAQIEAGADTIGMSDAAASMIRPTGITATSSALAATACLESCAPPTPRSSCASTCAATSDALSRQDGERSGGHLRDRFSRRPGPAARRSAPTGPSWATCRRHRHADRYARRRRGGVPRCHETCGPFHVVGAGCELSPRTPPENVHAMVPYAPEHTPRGALSHPAA